MEAERERMVIFMGGRRRGAECTPRARAALASPPMMCRDLTHALAALGLCLAASAAQGQTPPLFLDDFEDGGLTVDDVPPGRWNGLDSAPGTDAGLSAAAARAGARGLRFDDAAD